MPFIDLKTTKPISEQNEKELREAFGRAITALSGKSEQWLMLNFTDNCRMAFRGQTSPDLAMLEVKIYGEASPKEYNRLTGILTETVSKTLGIAPDRIYVKYEEIEHWGWNGENF